MSNWFSSKNFPGFNKYPAFDHVFGLECVGRIFPKEGVTAILNGKPFDDLDVTGHFTRVHQNGDMFAEVDGIWMRVNPATVDFYKRTKY